MCGGERGRERGGTCLIHCGGGKGRAGTVVACLLLQFGGKEWEGCSSMVVREENIISEPRSNPFPAPQLLVSLFFPYLSLPLSFCLFLFLFLPLSFTVYNIILSKPPQERKMGQEKTDIRVYFSLVSASIISGIYIWAIPLAGK